MHLNRLLRTFLPLEDQRRRHLVLVSYCCRFTRESGDGFSLRRGLVLFRWLLRVFFSLSIEGSLILAYESCRVSRLISKRLYLLLTVKSLAVQSERRVTAFTTQTRSLC